MTALDPFAFARSAGADSAASITAADPLIALGAERKRLETELDDLSLPEEIADRLLDRLMEIEDEIEARVPTSAAGAAVLVRRMKDRLQAFEWCEHDDRIADNLIAGLTRMGVVS